MKIHRAFFSQEETISNSSKVVFKKKKMLIEIDASAYFQQSTKFEFVFFFSL